MEKNGMNLRDLAMNVIFETSCFQDAYNKNVYDSKKIAANYELILTHLFEKHGPKDINFNLVLSLFDSNNEEKSSANFLELLENATRNPYRVTESITLTLTKYMISADSLADEFSMAAKTARVIRTMGTAYERLRSLILYLDDYDTIIKLTSFMKNKQHEPLYRIKNLE